MLLAYDAAGEVIATLDYMVARNESGDILGLIDFAAHEAAGGKLRDIWHNDRAIGSGTWPEFLGAQAHDFQVDLSPDKRIRALIHRTSGMRRERELVEAAISDRIARALGAPADLRDLVGGPDAPLLLDERGVTLGRSAHPLGTPAHLPLIGGSNGRS
jgi:hypothetical protein